MRDNDEARMTKTKKLECSNDKEANGALFVLRLRHPSFSDLKLLMIRKTTLLYLLSALSIFGQPPPSAQDILASVRMIEAQQQIDLQGQLRQNDVIVPFRLTQNGPLIRYSFINPDEVLELRLGEKASRLDLVTGAGTGEICGFETQSKNPRHQP